MICKACKRAKSEYRRPICAKCRVRFGESGLRWCSYHGHRGKNPVPVEDYVQKRHVCRPCSRKTGIRYDKNAGLDEPVPPATVGDRMHDFAIGMLAGKKVW